MDYQYMIKRIDPNTPKVPLKDFKHKELKRQQVIDPNLTPTEVAALQKQLYKENFIDKVLNKKNLYNELEKTWQEEDKALNEIVVAQEEAAEQELLDAELLRRGDKELFDPSAFQKAFAKTLEPTLPLNVRLDARQGSISTDRPQRISSSTIPHNPRPNLKK